MGERRPERRGNQTQEPGRDRHAYFEKTEEIMIELALDVASVQNEDGTIDYVAVGEINRLLRNRVVHIFDVTATIPPKPYYVAHVSSDMATYSHRLVPLTIPKKVK